MAEIKEKRQEYYIPDNFINEGRIFQGRFIIRNFIEAVILAAITGSVGLIIILTHPEMALEVKITMMVFLCGPSAIIGITGFNGDPISVVLKNALAWKKNNTTMLYNASRPLLKRDPLMSVITQSSKMDDLLSSIEARKQENIRKKYNLDIQEGKDYVFAEDQYVDHYTKRLKKKAAKDQGKFTRITEQEYLISSKDPKSIKKPVEVEIDPDQEIDLDDDISFVDDDLELFSGKQQGFRQNDDDLEVEI